MSATNHLPTDEQVVYVGPTIARPNGYLLPHGALVWINHTNENDCIVTNNLGFMFTIHKKALIPNNALDLMSYELGQS